MSAGSKPVAAAVLEDGERLLSFRPVAYQFAHGDDDWDANWLCLQYEMCDGTVSWSGVEPFATTFELEGFAHWLRRVVQGEPVDGFEFLEPCVCFRIITRGGRRVVVAGLAHELAPPYVVGEDRFDPTDIEFAVPNADLTVFADTILGWLHAFPVR